MTDSKISVVEKRERKKEREKWSTTAATIVGRAAPTQVNGDRVLFNKKREREKETKCKSIRREGKTVYLHIPAPYKCNLNEFVP